MSNATLGKRTLTVFGGKSDGKTVETSLSDMAAITILGTLKTKFAQDLYSSRAKLTANQMVWVHVLAMEASQKATPQPQPVKLNQAQEKLDMAQIQALFKKAGSKLQWPKVRFQTSEFEFAISLAGGRSKYPGHLHVAQTEADRYFGRITPDGGYVERTAHAEVKAILQEFAADPAGTAAKHGKLTGHCCFCARKLSDQRSLEVGYGQTCSKNYGLPW